MSRPRKLTPVTAPRSRYRQVEVRLWLDETFLSLEGPAPNAQSLWLYLLTTHRSIMIPGVILGREAVLADDLRWPLEGFRKAFQEVEAKGLAVASWPQGLTVLRRALVHSDGTPRETNRPASPNVVIGWHKVWHEIPECPLKSCLLIDLERYTQSLGIPFHNAFCKAFELDMARASVKPSDKGSRNQYSVLSNQEEEREASTASAAPAAPQTLSRTPPSDSERLARRQIAGRLYELQERCRHAIDPECQPIPRIACEDRIALAISSGLTEEQLGHVIRVYANEALAEKRNGNPQPMRYFNGVTPFDPAGGYANATRALSVKLETAQQRRSSDDDEWEPGGRAPQAPGVTARAARKASS